VTGGRAPRSDAVRNRTRILNAAREQITAHGPDIGMDEIAASAGVAVGTLYRHFQTKSDLVSAVIGEYLTEVAADAEEARVRVEAGAPALEELVGFLGRVVEASATNHAVKAAAQALGAQHGDADAEARASDALAALIKAAIDDGTLRADVTVADIYLLVPTAPTGQSAEARARWLTLVVAGLTNLVEPQTPATKRRGTRRAAPRRPR
jgi:AcrR family transcriptional regulator